MLIFSFFGLPFTGLPQKFNADTWAQVDDQAVRRDRNHPVDSPLLRSSVHLEGLFHVVTIVHGLLTKKMSLDMVPQSEGFQGLSTRWFSTLSANVEEMPKFGRYDYKQKFEYFAIVWGWISWW